MSMLRIRVTFLSTFVFIVLASSLLGQAPAPANLVVTSATKSSVVLGWQAVSGASSYVVQRRATGEGAYYVANNATTSDITHTDKSFDPFRAYTYRVFAIAGGNPGLASSEVTAGPPPTGFSVAAPVTPAAITAQHAQWYGRLVAMTLDANGDPAIAFQDGSGQLNYVYFVGWDRAHYTWKAPVKIDTVQSQTPSSPEISVAFDPSTNRLGVAYESEGSLGISSDLGLRIAFSTDGGATWSTPQGAPWLVNNAVGMGGCSLKMANGQGFLVYSLNGPGGGVWYLSGAQTAAPSTWTKQVVPGRENNSYAIFDVAVDSAGQPAVAYVYRDDSSGTDLVNFWRPSATTATRVTTSNGFNNMIGNPDIRLAFDGRNPRILLDLQRTSDGYSSPNLWFTASSDGGATWATPARLPNDGDNSGVRALITLAVGPQGQVAAAASADGWTTNGMKCGFPKLSRSTDLVKWTTCGPGNSPAPMVSHEYPSALYASNGKLYLAFQMSSSSYGTDLFFPGVWLWREAPQPSNLPSPQVNEGGVINNASHAAGKPVAPGSIIEIYGLNLANDRILNGSLPLASTLGVGPNPSVTTSVAVNGLPAPLYYISPTQINVQVPFATPAGTGVYVTVTVNDSLSPAVKFQTAAYAPGIYAAINANGSFNPAGGSAKPGDYLTLYTTGLGAVNNPPADGWPALANPLSTVRGTVTATIGGQNASVAFAGLTPGNVGLYQVNLQVPSLASGNYPLVISEGGTASNSVTISVAGP